MFILPYKIKVTKGIDIEHLLCTKAVYHILSQIASESCSESFQIQTHEGRQS